MDHDSILNQGFPIGLYKTLVILMSISLDNVELYRRHYHPLISCKSIRMFDITRVNFYFFTNIIYHC